MSVTSRINKIKYIKNSFHALEDKQADKLHKIFIKHIENESRNTKLLHIANNFDYSSDKIIDKMFKYMNNCIEPEENSDTEDEEEIPKKKAIKVKKKTKDECIEDDKVVNSEKYKLVLKFANGLLENSGKDPIERLTEFRNIGKEYIVTNENTQYLKDMTDELFKTFDKTRCRYYPKNSKNWVLNVLRGMIKNIGYDLVAKKTETYKNRYRTVSMMYEINK